MTDHSKPNGDMSASQLVALFADAGRHPKALNYELIHCQRAVLATLAAHEGIPAELAGLAQAEMNRRQGAVASLFGELQRIGGQGAHA